MRLHVTVQPRLKLAPHHQARTIPWYHPPHSIIASRKLSLSSAIPDHQPPRSTLHPYPRTRTSTSSTTYPSNPHINRLTPILQVFHPHNLLSPSPYSDSASHNGALPQNHPRNLPIALLNPPLAIHLHNRRLLRRLVRPLQSHSPRLRFLGRKRGAPWTDSVCQGGCRFPAGGCEEVWG